MADLVGQNFGNYRLIQLLGRGGFAEVYLGEHVHLQSQAAIKILNLLLTDEHKDNFLIEAKRLVQLRHPHIVRLLEFGVEGDVPFLVMEYAPNGSLRTRHPKGSQIPLDTVVAYVKQIADALHYIHEQKLVHRDVKPENMLLGLNNEIMLCDLGIAVVAHSTGTMIPLGEAGTAPYMAPEQIMQKPRPASDQYSLGIVVYEWLSGTRPFDGSLGNIAYQHLHVPPPALSKQFPVISQTVEEIVHTALAKDPKQRFASVQAFATALEMAARDSKQSFSTLSLSEQSTSATNIIPRNISSTQSSVASSSSNQELLIQSNDTLNMPPHPTLYASFPSSPLDSLEPPSSPYQESLLHQGLQPAQQVTGQVLSQGAVKGAHLSRIVRNISLASILLVLILGGVASYFILEQAGKGNPSTTQRSSTADTLTTTSLRTQTPLSTPTVQNVPLQSPAFDNYTRYSPHGLADGQTIYTFSARAMGLSAGKSYPILASGITFKLWLTNDSNVMNDIQGDNGKRLKSVATLNEPFPGEIVGALIFDPGTPQTQLSNSNGQVLWKYSVATFVNPGNYSLVVLVDWNGIHSNYGWLYITITKAG